MADLLIRDVPDEVIAAIDARAQRLGLSRTEYLRRTLALSRTDGSAEVTVESLRAFGDAVGQLLDPELMRDAWS